MIIYYMIMAGLLILRMTQYGDPGMFQKLIILGGDGKNRLRLDIVDLKPDSYKLRYKSDDSHGYEAWNAAEPMYPQFWGISIVELENDSQVKEISRYLNETKNENIN